MTKSHNSDVESVEMETKDEIPPKQMKIIATPRIKLKHNDISDEEFRLLMEHQKSINEVSIYDLRVHSWCDEKVICLKSPNYIFYWSKINSNAFVCYVKKSVVST